MRKRTRSAALGALSGAAAGVLGALAMTPVTRLMYRFERRDWKEREDAARGGESTFEAAARKLAGAFGVTLDTRGKRRLGTVLHYAAGFGWGALYGGLLGLAPRRRGFGFGVPFGFAVWLLSDEGLVTALHLAPPPRAFPLYTHLRGLLAHVTYGAAADGANRLLHEAIVRDGRRPVARLQRLIARA